MAAYYLRLIKLGPLRAQEFRSDASGITYEGETYPYLPISLSPTIEDTTAWLRRSVVQMGFRIPPALTLSRSGDLYESLLSQNGFVGQTAQVLIFNVTSASESPTGTPASEYRRTVQSCELQGRDVRMFLETQDDAIEGWTTGRW